MITKNPLLEKSNLPYGTPDFKAIESEHYFPAIIKAMELQNNIIKSIVEVKEVPSFENTILALEESSIVLDNIYAVFSAMANNHTNDVIKANEKELAPLLSKHQDEIVLNGALFDKVKQVYLKIEDLIIDDESKHLFK